MDGLQVSIACLLLKITFDPSTAQLLPKPIGCPPCAEGYFVMKNCSVNNEKFEGVILEGVQCKLCTDCLAADQDTLIECSMFTDSLCGNKTAPVVTSTPTPAEPPVSAPEVWIILTVIVLSLILVLLPGLFLTLLSCRNHQRKGLDLL